MIFGYLTEIYDEIKMPKVKKILIWFKFQFSILEKHSNYGIYFAVYLHPAHICIHENCIFETILNCLSLNWSTYYLHRIHHNFVPVALWICKYLKKNLVIQNLDCFWETWTLYFCGSRFCTQVVFLHTQKSSRMEFFIYGKLTMLII